MTSLLIRLFVRDRENLTDPNVRARYGSLSGVVGIVCNFLLFLLKFILGTVSGSVSIVADAINNLSDASSSLMTLIGFRISAKPADEEHPFGHARFEYLSGLGVAFLIFVIGFQLARESIEKILRPTETEWSLVILIGLLLSIGVKLWLALFYHSVGKKIGSTSLLASSADSRNDVISTAAVLLGMILSLFLPVNLDGYIGFLVALFILWSGFGIARETIKPLLGEPADPELVKMVENEILGYSNMILGIHDLVVHDYGPGQRFASVHAEIDAKNDVLEMHDILDNIEHYFAEKHNIHLVIHYDPIVTDDEELNELKEMLCEIIRELDPRLKLHDFRMVRGNDHTNLIFDLVIPLEYQQKTKELKLKINEAVNRKAKRKTVYYSVITFDSAAFSK